jgi:serine/threonine protein phosphatase PrpC
MPNPPNFQWSSATRTHVGLVRRINEDSVLDRGDVGLWVVADGMGGHAAGDVASQLIVDAMRRVEPSASLSDYVNRVEDALLSVNLRLVSMSAQTQQTSGSTVVALIAFRNLCVVIWAGDSRAYRLRNGTLQQLSNDHSHIEMYVEQGLITREEAAMHPAGNLITRAVGAAPELCLEMDLSEMAEGDRYLLSSDGLDKHVMQEEIANLLNANGTPDEIAQKLIEATLQRGAADNVSVAVIDIKRAAS